MEGEVSAPRMADNVGAIPAEMIEDPNKVGDVVGDGERARFARGRKSALLICRQVKTVPELVGDRPQILEAEARPSVEKKDGRPGALTPACQPRCSLDKEGLLVHTAIVSHGPQNKTAQPSGLRLDSPPSAYAPPTVDDTPAESAESPRAYSSQRSHSS
jgi:hypothetical protein